MSTVNLTGWADPELADRVKRIAAEQRRTVSFVVVEALEAWVARIDAAENTSKETGR